MRRKKQFVALSLAVILAFGGVIPVSSPISSVHAEEAQTELSVDTPVDDSTAPSAEAVEDDSTAPSAEAVEDDSTAPSAEAVEDDSTAPSAEAVEDDSTAPSAEASADDSTASATETTVEQPIVPGTDMPTEQPADPSTEAPAGQPAVPSTEVPLEQPVEVQVSDVGSNNPGISLFADSDAPIETGSFDFATWNPDASNVIAAGTYGNDVLSIELFAKGMNYVTGSKTYKDVTYTKAIKTKDKGSVTVADGAVTAMGALGITSTKDAEITIVMDKTAGVIHMMCFKDGQLKDDQEGTAIAAGSTTSATYTIKAGETYYFWSESQNVQIWNIGYAYEGEGPIEFPEGDFAAFPGAEGGGMYATGGRGGDVYVVTNLNDSGEGSLRYGIDTAPAAGRTIVFDVGGTINLRSTLSFKNKSNITIAGQTAPGDGITIAGYDTNISDSKNIVIRFVRFRVGSDNLYVKGADSMDALWGRDNDTFIIDHCTFSWNTDETLSTYRGRNGTVQWCIISESLTVSGHSKGRHGYGGIFGGDNTVFQYNLLTNHTSRNPRIGGGSMTDPIADAKDPTKTPSTATLQLSNNVLYNHGFYPCYGGGYAYTNYINNYVKPGVGTRESLMETLIHVGESGKFGGFYVNGNILEGNDAITNNNALGIKEDAADYISGTPYTTSDSGRFDFDAFSTVNPVSAADCYDLVLNSAGATFPMRDAIDARVVAQVRTDTGFYVNRPEEVGGYPARTVTAEDIGRKDSDEDGIPDDWEDAHGLNPNSPADDKDSIKPAADDPSNPNYGYSWLEVYCNDLVKDVVADGYVAQNPVVTIDLANNTLVDEGSSVTVTANATAQGGASIDRVEFYNGDQCVGTANGGSYSYTYEGLTDGTYNISVRAYDNKGRATQSDTSKLHVNSTAGTGEWKSVDVGNPAVTGTASLTDGVLTVKGAGKLGKSEGSVSGSALNNAASDDFHYVYQEMTGDAELVARLDSYTAVDCHTFNGLMFRESLDADAATVAVGLTMTKIWDGYDSVWTAFMVKRDQKGGKITEISETLDGASAAEGAGIPILTDLNFKTDDIFNGTWLKLTREGNVFTGAVSNDGQVWQTLGQLTVELPDTVYVGFAVEAGKAANKLENYSTAKFSDIKINTAFGTITYEMENVDYSGAEQFAVGEDIAVTLTNVTGYLLPETVKVIIDGKEVAADYDREKGIISLKNLSGDVVIIAKGVKRPVVPVTFEEVDPQDLLTVEEKDGKLILTQVATSGSTSIGFPGDASYKDSVNESWILFPEVTQPHEMTLQITVKELLPVVKNNDNTGVFIGLFDITEGQQAFDSLGFRPCSKTAEAVSKFWTKGDKTGNGGTKQSISMGTLYTVTFGYDANGQYTVTWENENGSKGSETFKTNENYLKRGSAVRYGIGLIGATVEITGFTYTDHEGNVIYNLDSADYSAVTAAIMKASGLNPDDYVSFDAVLEAWDAVELGLPKSEQAKVDAMAKAIEDAIAALERVSEVRVKSEVSESIPESVLTPAVKRRTKCTSVSALINYLKNMVVKETYADASSVVWDVTLKVSVDGGKSWIDASRDNMPKEGVDVVLPYPQGTNMNDYDFAVGHLITQSWNGQIAGTMEYPEVTKTEEGLKIHVMSASPFVVAWKAIGGNEPGEVGENITIGENITTQAVKTGDNMNVAAVIWSIVFLAAAAGAGVMVYRHRREANGKKTE